MLRAIRFTRVSCEYGVTFVQSVLHSVLEKLTVVIWDVLKDNWVLVLSCENNLRNLLVVLQSFLNQLYIVHNQWLYSHKQQIHKPNFSAASSY